MPFVIELNTPLIVGQYPHQSTVTTVRISAVSVNAQHCKYGCNGLAAMALIVEDVDTGRQIANPLWRDSESLVMLQQLMEAINPVTGKSFAEGLIERAQSLTDPVSGLPVVPPGTVKPVLTIAAAPASKVFGTANPAFTGTVTGLVSGDNITATYASAADTATPVGVYTSGPDSITPAIVDPDGKAGNYYIVLNNGTLTITES